MDSNQSVKKKRKAASDPPPPPGNDAAAGAGTILSANLSLVDLDRLIDRRVENAMKAKTHALTSRIDGLQRENEGLALRCESLDRSVQVLKKEGNWTYSAPDVPRSHWIDQGHGEEYADGACTAVRSIKVSARGLRSDGGGNVEVGCGTLILSDDVLNTHWEQLANAIQLSERITKINLENVQLDQRNLQMIEASVRQKGITTFGLAGNSFHGGEGVLFAIDVLKSNRSVEKFGWVGNNFHSTEDARELVDAVLEHPTISGVAFVRTFNEGIIPYTPVKRLFGGVGTDTLRHVDLSGNGIKTNGDRCIPDFLSTNPPLERLWLSDNRLIDDDALHITQALQSNTNLRYLDLQNNALTVEGKWVAHNQAVFGISHSILSGLKSASDMNLNTVNEANHTCHVAGIISETDFMNHYNESAKWNRGRKMILLLEKRHQEGCSISQLKSEFSKDCTELVPHVLARINSFCGDFEAQGKLSVLFELMRHWKMPEIYQLNQF